MAFYLLRSQRIDIIYYSFKHTSPMNIKITIKDADTPLLFHKNQLSEVQSKKKNALYKQNDKKTPSNRNQRNVSTAQKPVRDVKDDKNLKKTGVRSEIEQQQYGKAEKKMMEGLDKISKNQASLDMIHNSNNILRKQNQILQQNQKTLYNMSANNQNANKNNQEAKDQERILGQIKRQVDEMRKIKEEIQKAGKQFTRSLNQTNKTATRQANLQEMPQNVTQMNHNLQNLAQISKNQLQGLQNMQAIKSLQNFNIQGYSQAINGLKRQIVQYQKQSQQIERQLKLRAAKLQKLQINPNFDEQLLVPYQNYLKKRADAIDLHAIKQKTYEKLGHFDYSKFQFDISQIMAEVKNEMNQFNIICKQYRVQVPEIKIDQKELKGLDLKLPSAIDEYKAERGIDFSKPSETKRLISQDLSDSRQKKIRKKGQPIMSLKQTNANLKSQKLPQAIRQLNSKPLDLTTQVKFHKTNQPTQKTVLQNDRQRQKKSVEANFKKGKIVKEDADFQKYLEYRARQQLELIYKEKQERLQKKQRQLYQYCEDEPKVYLNLDLKNEVRRQRSTQPKKKQDNGKHPPQKATKQEADQVQKIPELKPILGTQGQTIQSVGTQILKQKLKNLLGGQNLPKKQPQIYQNLQQNVNQPEIKMQNVAGNFLSLINNTLTQVNNQLSRTIQQKFQNKSLSKQKKQVYRRSPPKLVIPTLEQFRPPPTFNLPSFPIQPDRRTYPQMPLVQQLKPRIQKKIVQKNYDYLNIKDQEDKYEELQISQSDNYDQDFQS